MISICIPVYNYNVVTLIQELSRQLQSLKVEGEIIAYDDFSEPRFKEANQIIQNIPLVSYKELNENIGRIQNRIRLANAARFPLLLFIDSDSEVRSAGYLSNYIQHVTDEYQVYSGGRIYPQTPPTQCKQMLHWKYGSNRETLKGKANSFHTNNFLIKKQQFLQLQFPEYLNGYGHEDTWMKLELQRKRIPINYIDNPVVHKGMVDTDEFLAKTSQALSNLVLLAKNTDKSLLRKNVSLYNGFHLLCKAGVEKAFCFAYKTIEDKILRNLKSCSPSLKLFDAYKLNAFIKLAKLHNLEK